MNHEQYESNDDAYLEAALVAAEASGEKIGDTEVRMIASQFHGGQWTAMYSLASCGAIDGEGLADEFLEHEGDKSLTELDKRKLIALFFYLFDKDDRGPVEGWSQLWGYL